MLNIDKTLTFANSKKDYTHGYTLGTQIKLNDYVDRRAARFIFSHINERTTYKLSERITT